ncbi:unnamed protein product [Effrenium voratum]|nr:unnamed protein product [Effrenium voratum]
MLRPLQLRLARQLRPPIWRPSVGRRPFCVHVHAEDKQSNVDELKAAARRLLEEPAVAQRVACTPAARALLKQMECASEEPREAPMPTMRQLELYFMHNFIPFIGFGFCDNFIMILAGDYIDARLGVTLGLSTMAAAAWGNTFSDVIGLWISGFIETFVGKTGLPSHKLTSGQMELLQVRVVKNTSMIAGILVGCIMGMLPLVYPEEYRVWPSRHDLEVAAGAHDLSSDTSA